MVKKFKVSRISNLNDSTNKDNYGIGVYQSPYSSRNASRYQSRMGSPQLSKVNSFYNKAENDQSKEEVEEHQQYQEMFRNCL